LTASETGWFQRHRHITLGMLLILLLLVLLEALLLYEQYRAGKAAQAQSDALLRKFLHGEPAASTGEGVTVRLQNVRFKWSDRVYVDAASLNVRAVALKGDLVNFDDLESFRMHLQKSVVRVPPDVLGGMFNESVFNYPDSKIRDLTVTIEQSQGRNMVVLNGRINVLLWIPFTMWTQLSVDHASNTMKIDVDHLKVFKVIPATKLIHFSPLDLENLISLPPNHHLTVHENTIYVKPFGLFPPPRIDGTLASVEVNPNDVSIAFAGAAIPGPKSNAKNYVYLRGGSAQFGHFRMIDTNILIADKNPANPFVFSILHYADLIPRSTAQLPNLATANLVMPDDNALMSRRDSTHVTPTRPDSTAKDSSHIYYAKGRAPVQVAGKASGHGAFADSAVVSGSR